MPGAVSVKFHSSFSDDTILTVTENYNISDDEATGAAMGQQNGHQAVVLEATLVPPIQHALVLSTGQDDDKQSREDAMDHAIPVSFQKRRRELVSVLFAIAVASSVVLLVVEKVWQRLRSTTTRDEELTGLPSCGLNLSVTCHTSTNAQVASMTDASSCAMIMRNDTVKHLYEST